MEVTRETPIPCTSDKDIKQPKGKDKAGVDVTRTWRGAVR